MLWRTYRERAGCWSRGARNRSLHILSSGDRRLATGNQSLGTAFECPAWSGDRNARRQGKINESKKIYRIQFKDCQVTIDLSPLIFTKDKWRQSKICACLLAIIQKIARIVRFRYIEIPSSSVFLLRHIAFIRWQQPVRTHTYIYIYIYANNREKKARPVRVLSFNVCCFLRDIRLRKKKR